MELWNIKLVCLLNLKAFLIKYGESSKCDRCWSYHLVIMIKFTQFNYSKSNFLHNVGVKFIHLMSFGLYR